MGRSCEMGKLCDSFHWLHCNLKTCDITEHVRVHLLQTTESRQRRNGKQEGELACLLPLICRWFFSPHCKNNPDIRHTRHTGGSKLTPDYLD